MAWKDGKTPYETLARKRREALAEAKALAVAVGRCLEVQPGEVAGNWTWLDLGTGGDGGGCAEDVS